MGIISEPSETRINTGFFACHFACWYWFDTKLVWTVSLRIIAKTSKTALLNDKIQQGGFCLSLFIFAPLNSRCDLAQVVAGIRPVQLPLKVFFSCDFSWPVFLLTHQPFSHETINYAIKIKPPKSRTAEGCPGLSLYGIFNRKFADSVDELRILTNRVKTLHKKRWKGWQTRKISLLYMCRQRKSRCLSTLHFLMNPFREEAAGTDFYLFTSA